MPAPYKTAMYAIIPVVFREHRQFSPNIFWRTYFPLGGVGGQSPKSPSFSFLTFVYILISKHLYIDFG